MNAIERRIILAAIKGLIAAGYHVRVRDEEACVTKPTIKIPEIMAELFACDLEYLIAYQRNDEGKLQRRGSVMLVHGNGADVIADYSVGLEPALQAAEVLAAGVAA